MKDREAFVRREMMATGPIASCRELPVAAYISSGMKDEYSPYSPGSPAISAYAMLCGMTIIPTVVPASTSNFSVSQNLSLLA